MDESVRSLIRFVSRGFYTTPFVLILDAVLRHSVLSEDDLIHLLGIKRKELRSLCNKLVEDRLLTNHIQREDNGQQKYVTRTYFFIHTTEAIDSIKWKVHSIVNQLKQEMSSFGNPQGYVCPRCGNKVSQLDAISMLSEDKTEFICDVCQGVLVEDDSSQQATLKQERLEKLMKQVDPIIKFLKIIDETHIQDNDFETALLQAVPAQSATTASYTVSNRANYKSSAPQSMNATTLVSITANDENYERELQEKLERQKMLETNALPSWYSNSTIGLQSSASGKDSSEAKSGTEEGEEDAADGTSVDVKKEDGEGSSSREPETPAVNNNATNSTAEFKEKEVQDREAQNALAAYYAQLAQDEAEEDDDDDDDEEFDDIL
ncbi:Transcription initiation factor IIE subunit alpha [Candida viswanathii]|uniref:Transcription initiation factor IIE subunit alpha n=1 Tax=Candida viswanathii TaxID=5486 RepID=A0A367YDX1_9ASCO|nr:Transcription initiation factor IIE subunit alpha [Candida viswanathii]